MSTIRIALANLPFAASPDESVIRAEAAIAAAAAAGAQVVCFPEAYVPGYRAPGKDVPPVDLGFLDVAWARVAAAGAAGGVAVVLGTERVVDGATRITTLVIDRDGTTRGFQDKVQLDSSEEATYAAGSDRQLFEAGGLTFGVAICHEGWRYPETVRWAARRGAQVVFHPHFHEAEPGSYRPTIFCDPANTFFEKAVVCRAAENTCFVATVNSPTTSAVIRPDATVQCYQPYGEAGLLIADLDLTLATALIASRLRSV